MEERIINGLKSLASPGLYINVEDLYDIYVVASLYEFDLYPLVESLNGLTFDKVELFSDFLDKDVLERNYNEMNFKHQYPKPDFDEVFCKVRLFTYPIFKILCGGKFKRSHWNMEIWTNE